MTNRTRVVMEGLVDVVAIIGLIVLGSLHVVDGAAILPLITLIAGGSIGARVSRRKPTNPSEEDFGPSESEPPLGPHSSILLLALAPFVAMAARHVAAAVAIVIASIALVVVASSCSSAQRVSATSSCAALLVTIGESRAVPPERAEADRQQLEAICTRYVERAQ